MRDGDPQDRRGDGYRRSGHRDATRRGGGRARGRGDQRRGRGPGHGRPAGAPRDRPTESSWGMSCCGSSRSARVARAAGAGCGSSAASTCARGRSWVSAGSRATVRLGALIEAVPGLRPADRTESSSATGTSRGSRFAPAAGRGWATCPKTATPAGWCSTSRSRTTSILGHEHEVTRAGVLDRRQIEERAQARIADYDVRPDDPTAIARALGGQPAEAGPRFRELAREDLRVLLCAQPTRGVDIGAIELIHEQLVAARGPGRRHRALVGGALRCSALSPIASWSSTAAQSWRSVPPTPSRPRRASPSASLPCSSTGARAGSARRCDWRSEASRSPWR